MGYIKTEYVKRKKIEDYLCTVHSGISNIIYNIVQYEAMYSAGAGIFFISLKELRRKTCYFEEVKTPRKGVIEGTPIHWEVLDELFVFWIE